MKRDRQSCFALKRATLLQAKHNQAVELWTNILVVTAVRFFTSEIKLESSERTSLSRESAEARLGLRLRC
jgi:hypothetical protein